MTAALLSLNRRTFASLRKHRNYRLFFAGQVVSVSGTWMQNIAMAWLVLALTGSPVAVGLLALFQFLPFTVFGLFSGVLVDRFDARRTVLATQAASMANAAVLAVVALAGVAEPWMVYALAAVRGTLLVLDAPARQALTFQMVGPSELANAVALNSSLFNAARVIGPAAGGLVVAFAGAGYCFAFNSVSFLAVLAGLLLMRAEQLRPLERGTERPSLVRGTREGIDYAVRSPQVRLALLVVLVLSTLAFNFNVLLPVLARETLAAGPETFGIISAAFGGGALAGALLSASLGRASWRALIVGSGGFAGAQLLLVPQRSVVTASVLLFIVGLCFTLWTSNANSSIQLGAPDHLRGRVVALYYYAFNGVAPLGGLLAGWLCAVGGTTLAFAVAGASGAAVTAFAATRRRPRAERALPLAGASTLRRAA